MCMCVLFVAAFASRVLRSDLPYIIYYYYIPQGCYHFTLAVTSPYLVNILFAKCRDIDSGITNKYPRVRE